MLFRIHHLPSHLEAFPRYDHMGNLVTTKLDSVSLIEIYSYISKDPALIRDLEARATLPAIVDIALTHPKGFSAYCTVSNTVKHNWYWRGRLPLPLRQDLRIPHLHQGSPSPQPGRLYLQQRSLRPFTTFHWQIPYLFSPLFAHSMRLPSWHVQPWCCPTGFEGFGRLHHPTWRHAWSTSRSIYSSILVTHPSNQLVWHLALLTSSSRPDQCRTRLSFFSPFGLALSLAATTFV